VSKRAAEEIIERGTAERGSAAKRWQKAYKEAVRERDEARAVARVAVTAWHAHQAAGHQAGCGQDEAEIQELYREHRWLKEGEDGKIGAGGRLPEAGDVHGSG
jgi:hypothetical protein